MIALRFLAYLIVACCASATGAAVSYGCNLPFARGISIHLLITGPFLAGLVATLIAALPHFVSRSKLTGWSRELAIAFLFLGPILAVPLGVIGMVLVNRNIHEGMLIGMLMFLPAAAVGALFGLATSCFSLQTPNAGDTA